MRDIHTHSLTSWVAEGPLHGDTAAMTTKGEHEIIPSWDGLGGAVAKELYLQECKAYVLGTKADERKLCGVRLWRRLKGAAKEILQDIDLDLLA